MFTIEFGPKDNRITMPGVKIMQVVPKAEALIAGGATELRIVGPDGKSTDLQQFKIDLGRMIVA
jgi:hypothetical protein